MGGKVKLQMVQLDGLLCAPYKFFASTSSKFSEAELNFCHLSNKGHLQSVKETPPFNLMKETVQWNYCTQKKEILVSTMSGVGKL